MLLTLDELYGLIQLAVILMGFLVIILALISIAYEKPIKA